VRGHPALLLLLLLSLLAVHEQQLQLVWQLETP
jgi:hypothetical protein